MAPRRRMQRSIMLFASEVPVISALNPYRKIEDVFLDVWRRTNPKQVAQLQQELSVELLTPDEKLQVLVQDLGAAPAVNALIQEAAEAKTTQEVTKASSQVAETLPKATPDAVKQEVVQLVTSTMNKSFGVKQEAAGILQYEEKKKTVVKERNLVFSKRKVARISGFDVLVGGKIDGRADGKVIEVKNRVRRFIDPLPKYDVAQLQTYLFILGAAEGELVEHLHAEKMETKMTKVPWNEKMWSNDIAPYLTRFGSALTYLMKDKQAQSDYLQSNAGQQREIIRYLWSQDVQHSE